MIQRIQTLWLLLAALVMATIFYFPIYKLGSAAVHIGDHFVAIILAAVSILLSLFTIFRFKKRKHQISLIWLNFLICVALLGLLFYIIDSSKNLPQHMHSEGYYWIGAFVPLVSIVFLFLAKAGVNKDEKLVKSLDRLR